MPRTVGGISLPIVYREAGGRLTFLTCRQLLPPPRVVPFQYYGVLAALLMCADSGIADIQSDRTHFRF
jgi:hypothetical protein